MTLLVRPPFNHYHQFNWSDGFNIVPLPTDPFLPSSMPLLVQFIPDLNISGTDENGPHGPNTRELGYSGDLHLSITDPLAASTSTSTVFLLVMIRQDLTATSTLLVSILIPSLRRISHLSLKSSPFRPAYHFLIFLPPMTLDYVLHYLSQVCMDVTVVGQPKIWWMDDVHLGWFDSSCAKVFCRQTTRIHQIRC
jgi:hypothetical protein